MAIQQIQNQDTFTQWKDKCNVVFTEIGDGSLLTSDVTSDLVAAINGVDDDVKTGFTSIGTLSSLTTSNKSNLVGAINEVDSHADTNAATISVIETNIGTIGNLDTSATDLVNAINELHTDTNYLSDSSVLKTSSVGAAILPAGNTSQRGSTSSGYMRFNTDSLKFEGYSGTAWESFDAGIIGGGGTDKMFFLNDLVITASYTVPATKNAMTTGPISVDPGVVVTIPGTSTWTII